MAQYLKFGHIHIELVNGNSGEVVSVMDRDEDYIWNIKGPVYPKHMKLMAALNEELRELDGHEVKKEKKS